MKESLADSVQIWVNLMKRSKRESRVKEIRGGEEGQKGDESQGSIGILIVIGTAG